MAGQKAKNCITGSEGSSFSPELIAPGRELYMTYGCAMCHGDKGLGDGPAGAALNPKPRNFTKTAEYKQGNDLNSVMRSIENGVPGTPMVGYAHISEEDRKKIANFVVSLQK